MTDYSWLIASIERANAATQALGLGFSYDLGEAASTATLRRCEEAIGLGLPPSLRDLLLKHNGLSVSVLYSSPAPGFGISLSVLSAEQIQVRTDEWRDILSATARDRAEAQSLAIVAEDSGEGQLVVIDTKERALDGECKLHVWPIDAPPIANSVAEFLQRALAAVKSGKLMTYWVDCDLQIPR